MTPGHYSPGLPVLWDPGHYSPGPPVLCDPGFVVSMEMLTTSFPVCVNIVTAEQSLT